MLETGFCKRWRRQPINDDERQAAYAFARQLGVHPLVGLLLQRRGLDCPTRARAFLHPKLTHLHDPALLPGVTQAAQRLAQAVRDAQPIIIYGDYDVDGITASSILWRMLRAAGADVSTYVPHRLEEGYGLNSAALDTLCCPEDGRKPVIVSVDCGITAIHQAAVCANQGVDLIITDHHEMSAQGLPEAHTLVHPRLPGSQYPFGELCGAGVAFKLAWQFAKEHTGQDKLPPHLRDLLLDLLSLAALGTVADIVPLVDENRVLTAYGLGHVKRTNIEGLNALIDAASLRDEKIDAYHVGFVLGPRLNACGRMGHAKRAVDLLTTAGPEEAAETAAFLTAENDRRRAAEREIFHEAKRLVLEQGFDQPDQRAIVVSKEGWHAGVVGIVASRLVEAFARPVIMLNIENGSAHGSARSVEGVSIHEALAACDQYLTKWGGHAMAAGLALETTQLEAFREALVAHVNQCLAPEDLVGVLTVDAECTLADLTIPAMEQIQHLAPFGRDNPVPLLCLRGVVLDRPAQRVGREGNHLRLNLRQDGVFMNAIAFGLGDLCEQLPGGQALDVVFEPKLSEWRGQTRVEIHVKDLKRSSDQ